MTIDITEASIYTAGEGVATGELLLAMSTSASVDSFEVDLLAAQSLTDPQVIEELPVEVPADEPGTSENAEDEIPTELLLWLGVTLPIPQELRAKDVVADSVTVTDSQVSLDKQPVAHVEWFQPVNVNSTSREEPDTSVDLTRSTTHDLDIAELPTVDSEVFIAPEPILSSVPSPSQIDDESLPADLSLSEVKLPSIEQVQAHQGVDDESQVFDVTESDAGNSIPSDRSSGIHSLPQAEIRSNSTFETTPSAKRPSGTPVELRTELSEVVRQVRTMITEHESRSTIQLEPAELGRMTLELIDAPEGRRAYVSAEDPAVMRFLERHVHLLESESRLQGVEQMSFTVGADLSGGLGRGSQRQSEAEASFRKTVEWNSPSSTKPRSRRELDTNA